MAERTIIIGGGIAGAAAAYWLAQDPATHGEVILLEGAARLGAHSSGRSAAIHRPAVSDPVTRALALETLEWLETRSQEVSERALLDAVGLVIDEGASLDAPRAPWADELEASGVARRLSAEERAALVPYSRPSGARTWLLPRAGRVAAHALVQGLTRRAERNGAQIETTRQVRGVTHDLGRVTGVELADGTRMSADTVVLAAGAWSRQLGAEAGCALPLAASTRHLFVIGRPSEFDERAPIVWDDHLGFYARAYDGGLLVSPCDQDPAVPDQVAPRYLVSNAARDKATQLVARALPSDDPSATAIDRGWCGLRDQTPDDRPVLGPDPRLAGLAWCAGFGGHGFTVGVAAGRALANALAGRDTGLPGEVGARRFDLAQETLEASAAT
ncbi:MAG: FAD-binding oxidoreductase [Planctomycetota bacterium]